MTVDSEKASNDTINLKIQIQDNGIGIAESDMKTSLNPIIKELLPETSMI